MQTCVIHTVFQDLLGISICQYRTHFIYSYSSYFYDIPLIYSHIVATFELDICLRYPVYIMLSVLGYLMETFSFEQYADPKIYLYDTLFLSTFII